MAFINPRIRRIDKDGFHSATQFPYVPRPIITPNPIERLRREALNLRARQPVEYAEIVFQQWNDVVPPLPQRRKLDLCHIEAKVKVLAETLFGDEFG